MALEVDTVATMVAALRAASAFATYLGTVDGDVPVIDTEAPEGFENDSKAVIVILESEEKRNGAVQASFLCRCYGGTALPSDARAVARALGSRISEISSQGAAVGAIRFMGATLANSFPTVDHGWPVQVARVTATMENSQL